MRLAQRRPAGPSLADLDDLQYSTGFNDSLPQTKQELTAEAGIREIDVPEKPTRGDKS